MLPQQTVPIGYLVPGGVYRLYHRKFPEYGWTKEKDLAVFSRIGGTGLPVFHSLGEPDMQSSFALEKYGELWMAIFERLGTPEDRGY